MCSDEKESDQEGTRTLNLPIRSRTPYPLGHAAIRMPLQRSFILFNWRRKLKPVFCKYLCLNLRKPCQIVGKLFCVPVRGRQTFAALALKTVRAFRRRKGLGQTVQVNSDYCFSFNYLYGGSNKKARFRRKSIYPNLRGIFYAR